MAKISITATLNDIFGNALATGSFGGLNVQLCGYGSAIPLVAGTAMIAQTTPIEALVQAGLVTFSVYENDAITPAGTYYTVQAVDSNGNVIQTNAYQFTSGSSLALQNANSAGLQNTYVVQSAVTIDPPQNGSITATFPNPNTAGNAILLVLYGFNRFDTNTVTDTQGNSYSSPFQLYDNQGAQGVIELGLASSIHAGANAVTFRAQQNSGFQVLAAFELTNVTGSIFDVAQAAVYPTTSSTYPLSLAITTTAANDALLLFAVGPPPLSSGGGRTSLLSATSTDNSTQVQAWAGVGTAIGAYTDSVSSSGAVSPTITGVLMGLKTSGSGVPVVTSLDLSAIPPYYPDGVSQPSAFSELVVLPYAANVVFPGVNLSAVAYQMLLTGSVTGSSFPTTYPGQLVSISVGQDSVGGHAFSFPGNVVSPQAVSLVAGSRTTQLFVTLNDGNLYALSSAGGTSLSAGVGVVTVPATATPVFNGQLGNVFRLVLGQNVTGSTIANFMQGQLYIFNIEQPATGSTYTFTWPTTLPIVPPVAMANGKQTSVLAAYLNDGTLLPLGSATYQ